jgi:peptidoglycan/LPS O-acetylase OafA/YrhL
MNLSYRADIDGLRAFAVSSVLIFHAFPSLIPGGFVGVDVFFVISGYLISGILFREIESSTFSFADFYARRIKRIFPALLTVLAASYAFGWFFLFSDDFRLLGAHIFRATLFLSNLLLMREAGYFDNAAETKPLLHLWSLAIEEQFYLVWPLIIWAAWRFKPFRYPLLVAITLGSFGWNLYQSQVDLTRDFYHPLTRFWELSAGAWLAFHMMRHPRPHRYASAISCLSCALLIASIYLIDNQIAIGVGVISYPLYLWHWPALAFVRIVEGATPSLLIRLSTLIASFFLAWATYAWLEKQVRFGWQSALKIPMLLALLAFMSYLGASAKNSGGYPSRPIMESQKSSKAGDIGHEAFHSYYAENFFTCADQRVSDKTEKWGSMVRCYQTKQASPIDLVMIGDSHAEHLLLGLSEVMPYLNIANYYRSDLPFVSSNQYKEIFESIAADPSIKYVLLTAMWADARLRPDQKLAFESGLTETITWLKSKNKKIILLDDTPKFGFDPQRCKFTHPLSGSSHCFESIDTYQQIRDSYVFALESTSSQNPDLLFIRMNDLFCDDQVCRMASDEELFFRDNNHLNILGSKLAGALIAAQIKRKYSLLDH